MAIKQRVLANIKSAYEELEKCGSCDWSIIVERSLGFLQEADNLSRKGIITEYEAKYKPIYEGMISALKQAASGMAGGEQQEVRALSQDLLVHLAGQIEKESNFKKEIVFLPYKASMWDSMESVWQAAVDDSDHTIAYVVPIPYFDRDTEGNVRGWHCDAAMFPKNVPVINYKSLDLESMHPDVIVIQNPYDDYNTVTSVDMKYYSRYLKNYTDKLVYIPYYVLEEIDPDDQKALKNIAHFFIQGEGVINAHLVIVQSDKMREACIRIMSEYTDIDRAYWEKKILGLGSPKFDKLLSIRREDIRLPETWRRVIEKADGTRKKTILYNVSIASLLDNKDKLLDKMEYVFQIFRERQDEFALLWRPHPLFESTIMSNIPNIWNRYKYIVERYRSEGWGIYDNSSDLHRAIALSDGYYGDESSLVTLFREKNIPVLIQDIKLVE